MKHIYLKDKNNKMIIDISDESIITVSECSVKEDNDSIKMIFDIEKFLENRNKKVIEIVDK